MTYATIDIGSNTALLLIARFTAEGQIEALCEQAEITRLSEGLHPSKILQKEPMHRTLEALKSFTRLCHQYHVKRILAIGTEALRQAMNAHEFVLEVKKQCGFHVEIIPGTKEAELAYYSAQIDFSKQYNHLVVLDIGAGSTELTWPICEEEYSTKLQALSLKMGSVRLSESFIHSDPISDEEFINLKSYIYYEIEKHFKNLKNKPEKDFNLIGLAGTLTTLSAIDQKMKEYDASKIQGAILSLSSIQTIIHDLKIKNLEERKLILGMQEKRADVLLAGALILETVMEFLKAKHCIVSDRGIRYALFHQRFFQDFTENFSKN